MGVFFCKKSGKWSFFVKNVDLFSTQGALCTVSVFFYFTFYLFGVRTHPTNTPPPAYGPEKVCVDPCPSDQSMTLAGRCDRQRVGSGASVLRLSMAICRPRQGHGRSITETYESRTTTDADRAVCGAPGC